MGGSSEVEWESRPERCPWAGPWPWYWREAGGAKMCSERESLVLNWQGAGRPPVESWLEESVKMLK